MLSRIFNPPPLAEGVLCALLAVDDDTLIVEEPGPEALAPMGNMSPSVDGLEPVAAPADDIAARAEQGKEWESGMTTYCTDVERALKRSFSNYG